MESRKSGSGHSSAVRMRRKPGGEFDRLAVGRVAIGFRPGFFACSERGRIGQTFCRHEALERGKPMIVVPRAVVGLTPIGSGFEFRGQRRGPFFPGEVALLGKPDCERKGLCLPGFGKDGSAFVARQARQFRNSLCSGLEFRLAQGDRPIN